MTIMHSVFTKDGEEWVADERMILTSDPAQYNCYRLSDGKHSYAFCHTVRANHKRYANSEEQKHFIKYSYSNGTSSGVISLPAGSAVGTITTVANQDNLEVRVGYYSGLVITSEQIKMIKFDLEMKQHYEEERQKYNLLIHLLKMKPFWKFW